MEEERKKLHVVMIPWLAFGHLIPFLELAKCLAKRGHRVYFISTPRNIERLPPIPPNLTHLITPVPLSPPPVDGLPSDAQATTDIHHDQNYLLKDLQDGLEKPICNFLGDLIIGSRPPDWIIYDMGVYWAPRVAHSFGLPCAFFSILKAATLCFIGPDSVLLEPKKKKLSPEELMVPPPWITNIPSANSILAFRYYEAVKLHGFANQDPDPTKVSEDYRLGTTIKGCNLVAVRTSIDFEPEWLGLLTDLYKKPILPVGFLSPSPSSFSSHQEESIRIREEMQWLDAQKPASTVYVAFGSEVRLSQEDVTELSLGLEVTQLPFLWAYRGDPALLPVGFQERMKGRGIVRMGWAPQPTFLAHPSVGAFLTHCGWSSTVEGLSFGKPLVMLPFIVDQGMNTRMMEQKKVGVEVARNERDGSFTRDAVAKALRSVMEEEEGERVKENAKKMEKIFGDKARHDKFIDEFVEHLVKHRGEKTPA